MKKFLRFIGILLLVLILIVVILGIIEPKDVTVERSITINGPREMVWDQMTQFKNGPNWDPWYKMEPDVARTYFGTDGQPGSGYNWVGKKTGSGTMKDTGINGDKMNYALHFEKPMPGDASGFYQVSDNGDGTVKVTWNYYQHMPFPFNGMQAFMSMDKMLGNTFDSGLVNLKKYVESNKMAMGSSAHEMQFPGHIYAGMRKTVPMADLGKFYSATQATLNKELAGKISGPATGLYYSWDTVKHVTDVAIVYPITDTTGIAKTMNIVHVIPSNSVMITHTGPYSGLMDAHMAIGKYMGEKNKKMGMVIEEYTVGTPQEPDSNKWVTNIYYLTN
ncbi:MAG: hypothetical protein BGO69_11770 [Bacteroidetes bacterium 46-16]|nr:MAG: hypothetical protein BGO69_11770 [Bacteroidetes bacterium 46-16]